MFRRLTLSFVLIVAGFTAGLVVTGRMRTASDSRADEPPAFSQEPRAPNVAGSAAGVAFAGGGPDFTRIAGQAIKGVANISSLQVVRTRNSPFPNDPFFRYFFGEHPPFASRDPRPISLRSGPTILTVAYA